MFLEQISEGCDTEDWRNDAENLKLCKFAGIKCILPYIQKEVLHGKIFSQYYIFCCIFD